MQKSGFRLCCLAALAVSSLLAAATWKSDQSLFSDQKSAEENRLAVVNRYDEWIQHYDHRQCAFKYYEGRATPVFFLQLFLGSTLEGKMRYAECSDGRNNVSHLLLQVRSLSRSKQKFTIGVRSVARPEDRRPFYSEAVYASKGSFIEAVEENNRSATSYNVHYRYRNGPVEVESGEIQLPADLPNKAHSYASLMTYLSDLVQSDDTFVFVMTDPYSAATQDEVYDYPLWRNEPFQVIKAKRTEDDSVSMRGWFPYAFGQLHADITICFGESKVPDLVQYRHPFMDVDLWRSSGASINQCKIEHDESQAKKRKSRFPSPGKGPYHE